MKAKSSWVWLYLLVVIAVWSQGVQAWRNALPPSTRHKPSRLVPNTLSAARVPPEENGSRRHFLQKSIFLTASATVAFSWLPPAPATTTNKFVSSKQQQHQVPLFANISDEELKQIVHDDFVYRQFLVTGNLTPHIYHPTATFTDEISCYPMDYWVHGTPKLFDPQHSFLQLLGDITVSAEKVQFRYDGHLAFRIPLVEPIMSLSGTVVLTRDDTSGLITSYREFWDQDVLTVLRSTQMYKQHK